MFDSIDKWLAVAMLVMLAVIAGAKTGDQATLRDCATTGRADMLGGGSISCAVIRTPAP